MFQSPNGRNGWKLAVDGESNGIRQLFQDVWIPETACHRLLPTTKSGDLLRLMRTRIWGLDPCIGTHAGKVKKFCFQVTLVLSENHFMNTIFNLGLFKLSNGTSEFLELTCTANPDGGRPYFMPFYDHDIQPFPDCVVATDGKVTM